MKAIFQSSMSRVFAALILGFGTTTVFAGGPLNLNPADPDGVERWPNGGANIPFNIDQGGLGPQNNAQATADVLAAFAAWETVPTATSTYADGGQMPLDVDETNFAPFLSNLFNGTNMPDGLSPVIFDEDGAIFTALFGVGTSVLGFTSPDTRDATGTPIEAVCFLNGGSILDGFPLADFFGVEVHELGHYSGLAHTVVNGQNIALGDSSGPSPNNDFGNAPLDQVETMYPFVIQNGGQATPHADDIGILSFLYPETSYFADSVTMTGTILAPNGTTPLTGVNVIARNVADPFVDSQSSISGDRGVTGVFTINGLTPTAEYEVFVDQILLGGFSTPPLTLPGPEEYYNGGEESNSDDVTDSVLLSAAAGGTIDGVDAIFNTPPPGDPLDVADDGFVQLFLPFTFTMCGQDFDSVFVNANGNVTFGAGDGDFTPSAQEFLQGPARVAPMWDDLNPSVGGAVTFDIRNNATTFVVQYQDVPDWTTGAPNSFEVYLRENTSGVLGLTNPFEVRYGDIGTDDGLAGFSCGAFATSSFEAPTDISAILPERVGNRRSTAEYEEFDGFFNVTDLHDERVWYGQPKDFIDNFEENNTFDEARFIALPFDSIEERDLTEIDLIHLNHRCGDIDCDVDYFWFKAEAGELFTADLIAGGIDSIMALFNEDGNLIASDDDGKGVIGGLSIIQNFPIPAPGDYVLAISTWPDFDFDGVGGLGGEGRYVMDVFKE